MLDLGTLGGAFSEGNAINKRGQVTGWSTSAGDAETHAFLWNGSAMRDLGTMGGTGSVGHAINSKGQVTGSATLQAGGFTHAFLWKGGAMHDLNDLIHPLQPNITLTDGVAINDRGQILANGYDSNLLQFHAYLVSPAHGK